MSGDIGELKKKAREHNAGVCLDFTDFLLTETSAEMEARMLADKYVLGRMAIMGQWTVFYGGPNVGKTLLMLWLLIEAIKQGDIDPANVFYIDADDTHKGLVEKKKLAEEHGFNMLVPGLEKFKAPMLPVILGNRVRMVTAHGCIVILDTLKKFTDLMNKKTASEFGESSREFVANGGTIIALAHVNKYKNESGESIHAGTSDIVDDADCAYIMDIVEDTPYFRTVKYRNIKDRGDVVQSAQYGYQAKNDANPLPYIDLFNSVREISAREATEAEQRAAIADKLAVNHELILAIGDTLRGGITLQGEILKAVNESTAAGPRKILRALKDHTGTDWHKGHRWTCVIGERNAHKYTQLAGGVK